MSQIKSAFWDVFRAKLRAQLPASVYEKWFDGVEENEELSGAGVLVLSAPSRYAKHWIENHYWSEVQSAAASAYKTNGKNLRISIEIRVRAGSSDAQFPSLPVDKKSSASARERSTQTPVAQPFSLREVLARGTGQASEKAGRFASISPLFSLDSFVTGPQSRVAMEAVRSIATQPAQIYNPLFLHGSSGLGKTHLLSGLAQKLRENHPGLCVLMVSGEEFVNAYLHALHTKKIEEFRREYRRCHALLVDDVHFFAGKDKTQEEFLHTFDALSQMGRQIVLASPLPPREITRLNPRLAERFQSGLVVRLAAPCAETRINMLRAKAAARGMDLAPDLAGLLADRIERSVRELEGVVCKMAALAAADAAPLNEELAIKALRELGYVKDGRLTMPEVLDAICRRFHVSADEVRGGKRLLGLVKARHAAMFLCKELTPHSLSEIGRFFGNRDHTTVLHGVRKIELDSKKDPALKQDLLAARRSLGR